MDLASLAAGLGRPGIDTRIWASKGKVAPKKTDADPDSVQFTDMGPIVTVRLEPSRELCACRVADHDAGGGEGSWNPFVEGDEVIVVLPEGDPYAGGVILGRLSNSLNKTATTVSGMDATKNNFAFRRTKAPYVHEFGAGFVMHDATSGAFLSVRPDGSVTLAGGDKGFLASTPDFTGLQNSDATLLVQADEKLKRLYLQGVDASIALQKGKAIVAADVVSLMGAGLAPAFHATSAESMAAFVTSTTAALYAALTVALNALPPGPLTGSSLGAVFETIAGAALDTIVAAGVAATTTPTAAVAAAVTANLAARTALVPGIGSPGVVVG